MADNCGVCLELADKYNCGWCGDQCDVQDKCLDRNHNTLVWLNKQQTCPDPQIRSFSPRSGPWEGGTNITIHGINLGRSYEDILGGVYIAYTQNGQFLSQINCHPFREEYVKTSRIVCQVQSPNITNPQKSAAAAPAGQIVVRVQNEYTAISKDLFSFVNPRITAIEPSKGPKSGGTRLQIFGPHMDAGSLVEAFVGNNYCRLVRRDKTRAECITTESRLGDEKVRVRFDNGIRSFDDYRFLFVDDPKITSVESGPAGQHGVPKGIPGGGITISVTGENLNSVQRPMMYVEVDGVKYNSSCLFESAKEMKCKSPAVPLEKLSRFFSDTESGDAIELHYGFIMDGVKSVQSLTTRPFDRFPKFLMFPNPLYLNFSEPGSVKYYKSDYLTINVSIRDPNGLEGGVIHLLCPLLDRPLFPLVAGP